MVLPGQSQERVRNVRIRVTAPAQLEIQYDLINARPGDSIYLTVDSRVRGVLPIRPEFVRGDVGNRVVTGSNRHIVWDALANGYPLNEEIRATVLVKASRFALPQPPRPTGKPVAARPQPGTNRSRPDVVQRSGQADAGATTSDPVATRTAPADQPRTTTAPLTDTSQPDVAVSPDTVALQKKRYAGPVWALLSVVAPGFGNVFVQKPRPKIGLRPLLAAGCYGLAAYGLRERQKSRDVYAVYIRQKNAEMAEPYYTTANAHYHRYYLATRGAIVVATADVILTFFKGLRNVRNRSANQPLQSVTFRPGLQAGQPIAVVRYSF